MAKDGRVATRAAGARSDLVRQYVRLQRELVDADPTSGEYDVTIQAFRQTGYGLISAGREEDLDRLLRMRVLDGGRPSPAPLDERWQPDLHLIECRSV